MREWIESGISRRAQGVQHFGDITIETEHGSPPVVILSRGDDLLAVLDAESFVRAARAAWEAVKPYGKDGS